MLSKFLLHFTQHYSTLSKYLLHFTQHTLSHVEKNLLNNALSKILLNMFLLHTITQRWLKFYSTSVPCLSIVLVQVQVLPDAAVEVQLHTSS
jgi:hypothetical protein